MLWDIKGEKQGTPQGPKQNLTSSIHPWPRSSSPGASSPDSRRHPEGHPPLTGSHLTGGAPIANGANGPPPPGTLAQSAEHGRARDAFACSNAHAPEHIESRFAWGFPCYPWPVTTPETTDLSRHTASCSGRRVRAQEWSGGVFVINRLVRRKSVLCPCLWLAARHSHTAFVEPIQTCKYSTKPALAAHGLVIVQRERPTSQKKRTNASHPGSCTPLLFMRCMLVL